MVQDGPIAPGRGEVNIWGVARPGEKKVHAVRCPRDRRWGREKAATERLPIVPDLAVPPAMPERSVVTHSKDVETIRTPRDGRRPRRERPAELLPIVQRSKAVEGAMAQRVISATDEDVHAVRSP